MRHLNIRSSAELTEIDIFGQIGDSFFEEGNTLETVKAELEKVNTELTINVASLGGSAFEGLAIHDLIASHPYRTVVNVVGATASAGAVISVAADHVNISENSLFLVHNSHGIAQGNANDLEAAAKDMRKIDDRMTSIFIKKTGKEEAEIRELLKEDKFLNASEALDWGFVDSVTQPVKAAAKLDKNRIINSNLTENQKQQLLKLKTSKMDLKPITDQLKDLTEKVGAFINANKEVKITDEAEVSATLSELNENLNVLGEENVEQGNTITALTEENKSLKDEIAKYKATPVEVTAKVDEEPTEVEVSNEGAFGNLIKSKISNRLTR
mgnify:CR=1 FL=1|tara:strand:- start:121 stop:1098 length:978 start_codon:yes stop_codon:yes gene_type:complete